LCASPVVALARRDVDAIASHGQTVFHDPPHHTLQLGDGNIIAVRTGITTVSDFRMADVAAGGNGAPLTSTMDAMLLAPDSVALPAPAAEGDGAAGPSAGFPWRAVQNIGALFRPPCAGHAPRRPRDRPPHPPNPPPPPCCPCPVRPALSPPPSFVCANAGGIGNVTLVPPRSAVHAVPLAFDTGPGNVLIDMAVARLRAVAGATAPSGAHMFDKDGLIAASGRVVAPLLEVCLCAPVCTCSASLPLRPPPPLPPRKPHACSPLPFLRTLRTAAPRPYPCGQVMLAHPYLALPPPKTTGRELYTQALLEEWWQAGVQQGAAPADVVATLTEYTARTIVDSYTRFCPGPVTQVRGSGGVGGKPPPPPPPPPGPPDPRPW
jgi:1,6-anhydro-N-acetylmuramate kinase